MRTRAFVYLPSLALSFSPLFFSLTTDLNPSLSTYGHPVITPNIERLRAISTQFDRAYVSIAVW